MQRQLGKQIQSLSKRQAKKGKGLAGEGTHFQESPKSFAVRGEGALRVKGWKRRADSSAGDGPRQEVGTTFDPDEQAISRELLTWENQAGLVFTFVKD